MARIEGTQSIPSELKTLYDGTLTPLMPNAVIRGRYPWKVPAMQEGGCRVSAGQKTQRSRWKTIRDKFKNVDQSTRERWYAARPQWTSLLWYYNYFMMSGLMGNAAVGDKGGGVIKDINHYTFTLPAGTPANVTIAVDSVDPQKAVCFFFGAGWAEVGAGYPIVIYPFLQGLNSSQLIAKASATIDADAGCSVSLIEYI